MIKKFNHHFLRYAIIILALAVILSGCKPKSSDPTETPVGFQTPVVSMPESDGADNGGQEEIASGEPVPGGSGDKESKSEYEYTTSEQCSLIPEGLCYHPYFPVIEGYTQTYMVTMSGSDRVIRQIRTVGEIQTGIQEPGNTLMDGFKYHVNGGQMNTVMDVNCFAEGIFISDVQGIMDTMLENMESGGEKFTTVSIGMEGITHPNNISPGDTWQSKLTWVMRPETSPEDIHFVVSSQFHFVGYESVDVPIGTFDARRIDAVNDVSFGVYADGRYMAISTINSTSTTWNVECIGLVKSSGESVGVETIVELTDYTFP